MDVLYVVEPGSYMRVSGEGLRIEKDGKTISEIPAKGLERLTIMGRCSMTGAVLDFLINNKVDTIFMSLTGRFRARLLLDAPGHVRLRKLQYERLGDEEFCLRTAKILVQGKIRNQYELLLKRSYRGAYRDVGRELRRLSVQLKALEKRAGKAPNLDELRGIEGYAARIFYTGFGMLIKNNEFTFSGRNKHPPLDPVNAMLSFVYTLYTNQVLNAIKACGLDPYLGALHEPESGRPSLACDLVEEWRASAELFVLTLINRGMVKGDDFVKTGKKARPIEMSPPFVRALISAYERLMSRKVSSNQGEVELKWHIYQKVRAFISWLKDPANGYEAEGIPSFEGVSRHGE